MIQQLLLLILFLFFLPATALCDPAALTGTITWVYDGDTVKVENIGKVRLLGIDTPEKEDSPRDNYYLRQGVDRGTLRRIADMALRFMIREAKGKRVTVQVGGDGTDRHGRTLAYIYLPDGRLLNRLLLEEGLAAVYRKFDFRLKADFLATEKAARLKRLGLWQ